jgi:hypothetical protein
MDYSILIKDFERPKAKIDYLSFNIPPPIWDNPAMVPNFMQELSERDDYVKVSGIKPKLERYENVKITIHDPSIEEIQFLINEYPNTPIRVLEIALDFTLKDGSNDPVRLNELHSWLKRCLFPQRHKRMKRGKRKFYDISDKRIKWDTLKTRSGNETIYWQDTSQIEQVRLYIKTQDNEEPIKEHSVRLEITLSQTACVLAKVDRIWMIPGFSKSMRRYLSPFVNVAKGIKPQIRRNRFTNSARQRDADLKAEKERKRAKRGWEQYGAAWAAEHGYKIAPDADTNRLIGSGLKGLQDKMKGLKMTEKVAECVDYFEGFTL